MGKNNNNPSYGTGGTTNYIASRNNSFGNNLKN